MKKPQSFAPAILGLCVLMANALSGCAMDAVEKDPAQAEARAAAMREDCYRRGGTWNEEVRTCVGADPARR